MCSAVKTASNVERHLPESIEFFGWPSCSFWQVMFQPKHRGNTCVRCESKWDFGFFLLNFNFDLKTKQLIQYAERRRKYCLLVQYRLISQFKVVTEIKNIEFPGCRLFGALSTNRFVHTKWSEYIKACLLIGWSLRDTLINFLCILPLAGRTHETSVDTNTIWLVCVRAYRVHWPTVSMPPFARRTVSFTCTWKQLNDPIFRLGCGKRWNCHVISRRRCIKSTRIWCSGTITFGKSANSVSSKSHSIWFACENWNCVVRNCWCRFKRKSSDEKDVAKRRLWLPPN